MYSKWDVIHYGQIVHRHDYECSCGIITLKIYLYKDAYYQSLWFKGICKHFSEVGG